MQIRFSMTDKHESLPLLSSMDMCSRVFDSTYKFPLGVEFSKQHHLLDEYRDFIKNSLQRIKLTHYYAVAQKMITPLLSRAPYYSQRYI